MTPNRIEKQKWPGHTWRGCVSGPESPQKTILVHWWCWYSNVIQTTQMNGLRTTPKQSQTIYYSRALCKRQKHDFQTVINFAKCTVNGVNVYSTCSVRVVLFFSLILFISLTLVVRLAGLASWCCQQLPEHHLNLTNKINCFICPGQYIRVRNV